MNKNVELLMKIQNRLNKKRFHLCVSTDLENKCEWVLFQYVPDIKDYFSQYNAPIMESVVDSIEELKTYLEKHNGFDGRW